MICTRCDGIGFLNIDQIDEETRYKYDETGDPEVIINWVGANYGHDVCLCDCCSDGDYWYNEPGMHNWNNQDDPKGCR